MVAEDAHVQLAPIDVTLDDRVGPQSVVDEADALGELLVGLDDRGLGDARRALLGEGLHDERELQPLRPLHVGFKALARSERDQRGGWTTTATTRK